MPSRKGVAGSSTGQACTTNSCRSRRAFSAFNLRSSISGSLKQAFQLLDFIGGKSGVVGWVSMGILLRNVDVSGLGFQAVEDHLNGPGGAFPRGLPGEF